MSSFFGPLSGAQGIVQGTAGALIAGVWQSALLVAGAGLVLKVVPRTTAAVRFAIWTAVFCVSAAMPFAGACFGARGEAGVGAAGHLWVDERWSYLIAAVWAAAVLVRLAGLVVQGWKLRGLWRRAVPVADDVLAGMDCVDLLGGRRVDVCTSEDVDRPSVIGFLAPRILVPVWLFEQLATVELRHIVLHEMEHLRRRDDWMNLLQKIGLVVFPLNPALFWVDRRLAAERELACDDGVLRRTKMPRAYANCLASIAEMRLERRMHRRVVALAIGILGAAGILRGRSEFSRRIESILSRRAPVSPMVTGAVAAVLLVMVMGAGVGLARAPELVSFAPVGGAQGLEAVVSAGGAMYGAARARNVGFRVSAADAAQVRDRTAMKVRQTVLSTGKKGLPQRLKPRRLDEVDGTVEAVALGKTDISMSPGGFAREGRTPGAKAHIETIDFIARAEALAYPEAEAKPLVKLVDTPVVKSVDKPVVKSVDKPVMTERWVVLTSFEENQGVEEAPARMVVRMPDGRFYVIPYAAVPVRDGWLIVQL